MLRITLLLISLLGLCDAQILGPILGDRHAPGGSTPTILRSACNGSTDAQSASVTFDTTGGSGPTTLALVFSWYANGGVVATTSDFAILDAEGNVYMTANDKVGAVLGVATFYSASAITNPSHTISITAIPKSPAPSLCVFVLTGASGSTPLDQHPSGAETLNTTTLQNTSMTPSVSNTYALTAIGADNAGTPTIDGGFTVLENIAEVSGQHVGLAVAGLSVSSPSALAPTWSYSSGGGASAVISNYKP